VPVSRDPHRERRAAIETSDLLLRPSLHDQLTGRLRDMIVQGELAAGERIDEKQLCQRFGISRTPFREALRVLSAEALVELVPNRSPRVAPFTQENVRELFDVMACLERYAGQLAAGRVREGDVAELRAHLASMERLHDEQNRLEYFYMNRELHRKIVALSGNSVLVSIYSTLVVRIQRARYIAIHSRSHWDRGIQEHREILDALAGTDGERLGLLLLEHSRATGRRVEALLNSRVDVSHPAPAP
jgi:DNA-binding GntR family transcriptional regulator